jgi:signal peptidase II
MTQANEGPTKPAGRKEDRNPRPRSKAFFLIVGLILITCIGCDQATKALATRTLRQAPPRSYLYDTLRLEYALNSGGFLSLGRRLPEPLRRLLLIGVAGIVLLGLGRYIFRQGETSPRLWAALTFILAGGLCNFIDRILHQGQVIDFISVGLGPVRTGIFNLADMAITCGALAVLVQMGHDRRARRPLRSG